MDKLISANAVLEVLGCFTDTEHGNPHFLNGIATAREIVEDAPEAVVCCEDCRCFDRGFCTKLNFIPCGVGDFCSWGERKEDGSD